MTTTLIDEPPRSRGWRVLLLRPGLLVGALLVVACSVPTHELVTPVLVMDVDITTTAPQSQPFDIRDSGWYSVNVELNLLHGPQGPKEEHEKFVLTGAVVIQDVGSDRVLEKRMERVLMEYEVGARLFDFGADEVGGKGEKMFTVTLNLTPEFARQYSGISFFIRKQLKYPMVD